jgi:DNA-binding NarL/FixJ family response regulator
LARSLHESLLNPLSPAQAAQSALRLQARAAVAARFEALTQRERQVLVALAQGLPAARIAEREHLSLATVRSHIQSILAKLDTSSQLAAVALTHGACGEAEVLGRLRELHQF